MARCRSRAHFAISGLLLLAACQAALEEDSPETPPPASPTGMPQPAGTPQPGASPARTWKLSHVQYARAVQAFVGVRPDTSEFEAELDNGVYPNMSGSGLVRATLAHSYYDTAERIAAELTREQLAALIDGRPLSDATKGEFLQNAIRRAFRRPPTPEDLEAYTSLYDLGRENDSDGTGPFRAVIRGLLTSPFFLYRTEIGSDPAQQAFELTQHELASLLSFSLLDAPPPSALLEAADAGRLADSPALARQLEQLLDFPEAGAAFQKFLIQWMKLHHFEDLLDKDPLMFPTYRAVRSDMVHEAEQFVSAQGDLAGDLDALLTTPVLPTGALAEFYGSDASAAGEVGTRTGLLGLGAVLAARSKANATSPTLRGLFIRERLLCQHIQLPPDSVPDIVRTIVSRLPRTTRETYQFHAEQPACAGCHVQLDAIGLNFEDFDAAGRFRKLENGVPIDTHGELINSDVNAPTQHHTDLALRLADSEWVRNCFVQQAFRYYFGRVEASQGVSALQAGRAAFAHGGSFRTLLVALWSSPNTRERVRQP